MFHIHDQLDWYLGCHTVMICWIGTLIDRMVLCLAVSVICAYCLIMCYLYVDILGWVGLRRCPSLCGEANIPGAVRIGCRPVGGGPVMPKAQRAVWIGYRPVGGDPVRLKAHYECCSVFVLI